MSLSGEPLKTLLEHLCLRLFSILSTKLQLKILKSEFSNAILIPSRGHCFKFPQWLLDLTSSLIQMHLMRKISFKNSESQTLLLETLAFAPDAKLFLLITIPMKGTQNLSPTLLSIHTESILLALCSELTTWLRLFLMRLLSRNCSQVSQYLLTANFLPSTVL